MNNITVDFSKSHGPMKPLHGMNNAPVGLVFKEFLKKFLSDTGAPFCRLHDTKVGMDARIATITTMFPDFSKDANDPASYDFIITDYYVTSIMEAGSNIFFRLGQSIEWGPDKHYIAPPADYQKWAEICEHIIRHYTEGWANGFHYDIQYWEIWNEPEMPPMWTGTKEQFFELYTIAAKHLKKCFPHLKIGGYGSCGFPTVTRENPTEHEQKIVPYFNDFLTHIKKEQAPIDFFSWHIYSLNAEENMIHARYAREALNKAGFENIEIFMTEWNHNEARKRRGMVGACYVESTLCGLQCDGTLDGATYYAASSALSYIGVYDLMTNDPEKPYYAFTAFQAMYRLGTFIKPEFDFKKAYACAAKNDTEGAFVLVNPADKTRQFSILLKEIPNNTKVEFYILDDAHDLVHTHSVASDGTKFEITYELGAQSILLLKLYNGEK